MADRVSASIVIGGTLPADQLASLVAIIDKEGLATKWDGPRFDQSQLCTGEALHLMAHDVAWGRFEALEIFCIEHGLPFARWSGAYPGQWGAERVVFTGTGAPASYACDEHDCIVVCRETAERLRSMKAIRAYFDAADFAVPPLEIIGGTEQSPS